MDKDIFIKAFKSLDSKLGSRTKILVGGGAALLLAHGIPLTTMDIDGLLFESVISAGEFDKLVKEVAEDLHINKHWFNSYFGTFTYTIAPDYKIRLKKIFDGKKLKVFALGLEDLLVMKCFSGREKDIGHSVGILKGGVDLDIVETQMERMLDKGVPGAEDALDFLDEIKDRMGL